MAGCLLKNWKQSVFYKFDQPMTLQIINEINLELYKVKFIEVAIVSDMGSGNTKLLTTLNISYSKACFFNHPGDNSLNVCFCKCTPFNETFTQPSV